jgi:purine-binding chemotaxis protein CheW
MEPQHRTRSDPARALVGFHVGEGYYAVDVPSVREIIAPTQLVAVPHSSPIVRGVTDHRGHVVPIVDLRKRFSLAAVDPTRRTKWIIIEARGQWLGLVVDDVTEVFSVTSAHERTAPRLGPTDVALGFARVYAYEGELVLVLDLEVLARAVEDGLGAVTPPSWKPPPNAPGRSTGGGA